MQARRALVHPRQKALLAVQLFQLAFHLTQGGPRPGDGRLQCDDLRQRRKVASTAIADRHDRVDLVAPQFRIALQQLLHVRSLAFVLFDRVALLDLVDLQLRALFERLLAQAVQVVAQPAPQHDLAHVLRDGVQLLVRGRIVACIQRHFQSQRADAFRIDVDLLADVVAFDRAAVGHARVPVFLEHEGALQAFALLRRQLGHAGERGRHQLTVGQHGLQLAPLFQAHLRRFQQRGDRIQGPRGDDHAGQYAAQHGQRNQQAAELLVEAQHFQQ